MPTATHHLHKRKRTYGKKEPYPHPKLWKRILDKLVYVVGVLGPLSTIPQILKVWVEQSASGVAILTWIFYFLGAIVLLFYGIAHKEKPLIIMYSLWIVVDIILIIGIILYG